MMEQGEGQDFRFREPRERFVASPSGVDEPVGVVGEAAEHGHRLCQGGEWRGVHRKGYLELLWSGSTRMALFYSQTAQQTSYSGHHND